MRSAPATSPPASPAVTPTTPPAALNVTKTGGRTAAFVVSKHVTVRYFTAIVLNTIILCCVDSLTNALNLCGIFVSHRSDVEEISASQPTYTSLSPETHSVSSKQTVCWASWSEDHKSYPSLTPVQDHESSWRRESEKKTFITESIQRSRTNRIRRGMMAGPIASTPQVLNF